MVVECRETSFGCPVGEPEKAYPGIQEWLNYDPGLNLWHIPVGTHLRIRTSDTVAVTDVIGGIGFPPRVFEREAINEQNLQTSPFLSLRDLVLWRRRHYSWREE